MSKLGAITNVDIKDDGRICVDVITGVKKVEPGVVFATPSSHAWFVPNEGEIVEMQEVRNGNYIAYSPLSRPEETPKDLGEGDIAIQLDAETFFHFKQRQDGNYDLSVSCSGDVHIDAENLYLGEDGNRKKVALEDHTHEYDDDDGNGTTTKTTSQPNSGGISTVTEVE